ncbi:MAG: hypothetical protein Q8P20_03090 [bacterium]|nr:hypothetical protein [bacterium]
MDDKIKQQLLIFNISINALVLVKQVLSEGNFTTKELEQIGDRLKHTESIRTVVLQDILFIKTLAKKHK